MKIKVDFLGNFRSKRSKVQRGALLSSLHFAVPILWIRNDNTYLLSLLDLIG